MATHPGTRVAALACRGIDETLRAEGLLAAAAGHERLAVGMIDAPARARCRLGLGDLGCARSTRLRGSHRAPPTAAGTAAGGAPAKAGDIARSDAIAGTSSAMTRSICASVLSRPVVSRS